MNPDLTEILSEWPFQPGMINARLVEGQDGEPRLQVRVELGILQMYLDGRPDGERPQGALSLLDAFEAQLDAGEGPGPADPMEDPRPEKTNLSPDDCRALREEAAQYYQRYVALMALEDYDRVVRDTARNLRVLDLCKKHAQADDDRVVLEKFRPYITMVRARALASMAIADREPKAAVVALDEGLDALRQFFADAGQQQAFEASNEVQMLRVMREALLPKLPVSLAAELRARLARALEQENYELAAILRDELKAIKDDGPAPKPDEPAA